MGDLPVSKTFEIQSYTGAYQVYFENDPFSIIGKYDANQTHFIIDENVLNLYKDQFSKFNNLKIVPVNATEENKSFEKVDTYLDLLLDNEIKRDHKLVAIGGGITQDITCFIASTLYRGIDWDFFPSTLLAQSDSCIGSKSSINYKKYKNLIGTFNPPRSVYISTEFQKTLQYDDVRSGIGEMIKVHIIDSIDSYRNLIKDYDQLNDADTMIKHLYQSLQIKKKIIEVDEFDKGIRNVMNYGHSFGHAIESATNFGMPHGVAVTLGMDIANYVSMREGYISEELYNEIHEGLVKNYKGFEKTVIPFDSFIGALGKDKKNKSNQFAVILINKDLKVQKMFFDKNTVLESHCQDFFNKVLKEI